MNYVLRSKHSSVIISTMIDYLKSNWSWGRKLLVFQHFHAKVGPVRDLRTITTHSQTAGMPSPCICKLPYIFCTFCDTKNIACEKFEWSQ